MRSVLCETFPNRVEQAAYLLHISIQNLRNRREDHKKKRKRKIKKKGEEVV